MKAVVAYTGPHDVGTPEAPRPCTIVQILVEVGNGQAFPVGTAVELIVEPGSEFEFPVVPTPLPD